jgi:hypothetical protein
MSELSGLLVSFVSMLVTFGALKICDICVRVLESSSNNRSGRNRTAAAQVFVSQPPQSGPVELELRPRQLLATPVPH